MAKRFRPWDPKQKWLLSPEITEFIPEGHPAHFVRDLVVEELDLAAILDSDVEDKGYRLRKQVVEPVFGQIKQAMGFRQFLLRGLTKVKAEWQMVCTAHNLLKLARAAS